MMRQRGSDRPSSGAPRTFLLPLFLLSGACDLIYEVAWGRALGLIFGVTVFAVSAVLASFMLGLAIGGVAVTRLARSAAPPALLFARLHLGIALSAAATLPLLPVVRSLYVNASQLVEPGSWALRPAVCVLSVILLLVPTALMGATFPVAAKILAPPTARVGRDIGSLYAAGTVGSIFGCVVAVSVLLPLAGLRGTIAVAALADLAIGLLAPRIAMPRASEEGVA
jgi:spermidine synthase